tara:strand:- start:629 stop:1846 length:1218 start_codon:yes stop_codon:yes gene_type:complete
VGGGSFITNHRKKTKKRFLPYGRQTIDEADISAVVDVLRGDWLTTGPSVNSFEKAFSNAVGSEHAVACSSGTAALHLMLMGLGVGPGDWVIVPSLTFLATANAVRYTGAEVFFADVNPETGIMNAEQLSYALAKSNFKPKAIIAVHLNGQCVSMQNLKECAGDIILLEDACHALGSLEILSPEKSVKTGSCYYSHAAAFSSHAVKTIASGEGGVVTTNDYKLAEKFRLYRNHGMVRDNDELASNPWHYEMHSLGFNYRLTDIQCALGLSQLSKLERFVKNREKLRERYSTRLRKLGSHVKPVEAITTCNPAWHLAVALIDFEKLGVQRVDVMRALSDLGVGTQVHYIPVHKQPYYQMRYGKFTLSGCEAYYSRCLSLPLWPDMTLEDVDFVVEKLADILGVEQNF